MKRTETYKRNEDRMPYPDTLNIPMPPNHTDLENNPVAENITIRQFATMQNNILSSLEERFAELIIDLGLEGELKKLQELKESGGLGIIPMFEDNQYRLRRLNDLYNIIELNIR